MAIQKGIKQVTSNKKAWHDYFVDEKYEAGIELVGTEVKSIRLGQINLKDAYCSFKDGELFVVGMHISPYEKGNIFNKESHAQASSAHAQEGNSLPLRQNQAGRLHAHSLECLLPQFPRQGRNWSMPR